MYEKLERSSGRVLGYEVRDELTENEIESILQDIERVIAEEGSVRLLVAMPTVPRPDPAGLDEDLGFWLEHGDDIERYAIVGDSTLVEWVTEVEDRISGIDFEYFEPGELDDAWSWVE